ncbi:MAG TPA: ABC transporter ATP-binding protein [Bacteroidetes bacterium]|nr:ABC transporter ATP-binding protein [Bacteroidota bacterium]
MSSTADHIIEADKLTKRFGDFTAVDAISFKVKKGEIFGFLGANGAGKTTAIRMLIGLSRPTEGEATVAGFDVYRQADKIKENIGYMSQKFSLYEDLTVRENIRFYGGIYGLSRKKIKEQTGRIIEEVGLENSAGNLVGSLPLGWKQRLAFAVSMVHSPSIVFLDEPTGGVDPAARRQFWEMIYQASAAGRTVFVTTHYMDEAEYCDRVSIMVSGKIEALGSPAKLKEDFSASSIDEVFVQLARGGAVISD